MTSGDGPERPAVTAEGRVLRPSVPLLQYETFTKEDGIWRVTLASTPTEKSLTLVSPHDQRLQLLASEVEPTWSQVSVLYQDDNWNSGHSVVLGTTTVPWKSDLLVSALSILLGVITRQFASGPNDTVSPSERPATTPASEEPGPSDTAPEVKQQEPTS
jgi:hypothetical protein